MPDQSVPAPLSEVVAGLHLLTRVLRVVRPLGPEAQDKLADLVEALTRNLPPEGLSTEETTRLAESMRQFADAVQTPADATLLAAARDRLEEATLRAEARVPHATDLIQRLLETLAQLGI